MRIALAICLAAVIAMPTLAQGQGRGGPPRDRGADAVSVGEAIARTVFGARGEREIRDYYQSHSIQAQSLPPGIAKNLARGKPLPPGIAKRHPPGDLMARLPAYPGHEVLVAGADVILVETATQIVADILYGVL